ncbi:hypothetical protein FACS1894105_13920 [Clostridia bacterium]|nr:hypothetical protein FACS1894105_13920 [Clostridia bacterium]
MPRIRTIPATIVVVSAQTGSVSEHRRVAGYARVSTETEEQLNSYEAQIDYYTKLITGREDWTLTTIYTDEGISAVNTKKREGFKKMVADGMAGKFDLLITKSVSRFARNTVDSLTTVRQLKEKGVEVWFEKENIFTLDSKGELLITIMSSLAQEESRSISENVTWGMRKNLADGKVHLPYKQFLGYEKGDEGLPSIVESEAETVRLIYRLFTEGEPHRAVYIHHHPLNHRRPQCYIKCFRLHGDASDESVEHPRLGAAFTLHGFKIITPTRGGCDSALVIGFALVTLASLDDASRTFVYRFARKRRHYCNLAA